MVSATYTPTTPERLAQRLLQHAPRHIEADLDERSFWDNRWAERISFLEQQGEPFEGHDEWQRWISKMMYGHYVRLLDGRVTGRRTVELGSGSGYISLLLARAGATVTLVDFSPRAIEYSRRIARLLGVEDRATFLCRDFLDIPENGAFDLALNSGVAEHYRFDEAVALARTMARAVRPGGVVSVTIPNLLSPEIVYRMAREGKMSERYFSARELRAVLRYAGLHQVRTLATNTVLPSFLPMPVIRGAAALRPHRLLGGLAFLVAGIGVRGEQGADPR